MSVALSFAFEVDDGNALGVGFENFRFGLAYLADIERPEPAAGLANKRSAMPIALSAGDE